MPKRPTDIRLAEIEEQRAAVRLESARERSEAVTELDRIERRLRKWLARNTDPAGDGRPAVAELVAADESVKHALGLLVDAVLAQPETARETEAPAAT